METFAIKLTDIKLTDHKLMVVEIATIGFGKDRKWLQRHWLAGQWHELSCTGLPGAFCADGGYSFGKCASEPESAQWNIKFAALRLVLWAMDQKVHVANMGLETLPTIWTWKYADGSGGKVSIPCPAPTDYDPTDYDAVISEACRINVAVKAVYTSYI